MEELFKDVKHLIPDIFNGSKEAQIKFNNLIEGNPKKKEWLDVVLKGSIHAKKKDKILKVKAYERVKFYDDKTIAKGFATGNFKMDHDLKIGDFTIWTLRVGGDLNASNTVTIHHKPNGKPAVEIEAGAKILASDKSKGWLKVAYANEEGELQYGYVLEKYCQKLVHDHVDENLPNQMSVEEPL